MAETTERPALVEEILEAQEHYYSQEYPYTGDPAGSNYVTNIAHPCAHYGLLARRYPSARPENRVLAMFEQGHETEAAVKYKLQRNYHFDWALSQLRITWDKFDIVGRIDGIVTLPGEGQSFVCEIKAFSANAWRGVKCVEDFFGLSYWRHRTYPAQVLLYLWMIAEGLWEQREKVAPGRGIIVLSDKASTELKPIWVYLDGQEDYVEGLLQRALSIKEAVAKDLPELPKLSQPSVCLDCDFNADCMPGLKFAAPLLATDERFIASLDERAAVEQAGKDFRKLDAEVKDLLKRADWGESDTVLAGEWMIVRKVSKVGAQSFKFDRTNGEEEE